MRVDISAEAERDLREIAAYIAQDDARAAARVISSLRAACAGLAEYPKRFPVVPRYEQVGVRRRIVGNYLIFYRIEEVRAVVVHVVHGAMDYSGLLGRLR